MKNTKFFALATLLIITLSGCKKDNNDNNETLTLPQNSFSDISFEGQQLSVAINSTTAWSASSDQTWCVVNTVHGNGSSEMSLTIAPNYALSTRTANISIQTAETTRTIEVKQNLWDLENYTFKLPVIFHILYNDPLDENQYVREGWMKIILEEVNKHFNDGLRANSTDMQVEFVMATHTPDGEQLAEPGVERVKVGFSHVHPIKFLVEYSQPDLLWDTEKYINIFICGFLPPYGSSHGYSMTSYSVMPSALEDLEVLVFWPTHDDVNYMHSIVVNNLHIYKLNSLEQFDKNFSTAAAPSSIAYDLGSYLGLFDIYSMSEDGDCADTDYCADTPCYDRDKYRTQADEYIATHRPFTSDVIKEVIKRTDCVTGEISTPNNVMDLFYSWRNRFTPDQKKRVRHVLTYSPLLPGPKIKPETKALNSKGTRVLVPKHIK